MLSINLDLLRGKKFEIFLDKKIPMVLVWEVAQRYAATLILLRNLYNKKKKYNKLTFSKIFEMSYELGSDVPACLMSKDLKLKRLWKRN